jgi:hypothetical protein
MSRLSAASVAFLLLFLPLLWISQYAYPSGDDFQLAFIANKLGPVGAMKWWYFNGCGRYSYTLLQSLISVSRYWLVLYRMLPPLLLLVGFGSVFYFLRSIFGLALGRKSLVLLSAASYALLLNLTPDIATAFYWLTTSIQYVGAVFASLLVFALLREFTRATRSTVRLVAATLIIFLILLVAGMNEVSALFMCAALASVNLLYIARKKKPWLGGLAFATLSVVGSLFSFYSPGTSARLSQASAEVGLIKVVAGAISLTLYLLFEFLLAKPILPATVLYFAFLSANRDRLAQARSLFSYVRWDAAALLLLGAMTGVNIIIFTAIGPNSLVDRVKNVYVYSLFFGWFILMTAVFFQFVDKRREFRLPKGVSWAISAFLVGFLVVGSKVEIAGGNAMPNSNSLQRIASSIQTTSVYTNAFLDLLSGRAAYFAEQNRQREAELRMCSGEAIDFSLYSHVPETIFIQDVNHPFGEPNWLTAYSCGRETKLNYRETGPQVPQKKKF